MVLPMNWWMQKTHRSEPAYESSNFQVDLGILRSSAQLAFPLTAHSERCLNYRPRNQTTVQLSPLKALSRSYAWKCFEACWEEYPSVDSQVIDICIVNP